MKPLCCLVFGLAIQTENAQLASPQLRSKGMLSMKSMKVASKIYIGPMSEFSMGADSSSTFSIQQSIKGTNTPLLEYWTVGNQDNIRLGAQKIEAMSVDVQGSLSVHGIKQWQLVQSEDFTANGAGWSRDAVTHCAGIYMLGGYCKLSHGEVNKTFSDLPPHKQLRIVATYHFIDRWIGETGYLKLNIGQDSTPVAVWSEQHSQEMSHNGMSLCGNPQTPEGKFSSSIDVTVPHHSNSVQLSFGSTMQDSDPCDESWGVSGLEIYTRA